MVQRYDFVARVREEVELVERELEEPRVRQGLEQLARRLQLPADTALAAVYRAAKRSGYTLKLMLEEVNRQLETEEATRIKEAGERSR